MLLQAVATLSLLASTVFSASTKSCSAGYFWDTVTLQCLASALQCPTGWQMNTKTMCELTTPDCSDPSSSLDCYQVRNCTARPDSETLKWFALTFEAGPSDVTISILKVLSAKNVKATFFFQGENLRSYPWLGRSALEAGHVLAAWGDSGDSFSSMSASVATEEVLASDEAVYRSTFKKSQLGKRPTFFRYPWGRGSITTAAALVQPGSEYTIIGENLDYRSDVSASYYNNVKYFLENRSSGQNSFIYIGRENTTVSMDGLGKLIDYLQGRGDIKFVTMDQCTGLSAYSSRTTPYFSTIDFYATKGDVSSDAVSHSIGFLSVLISVLACIMTL